MRKPTFDMNIFAERRKKLGQQIPGSALVVASHPELIRNHDVHFPYRQDSNMFYLTGWEEPESILIVRPGQTPESVMFVRRRDRERETWDGFRYGPEGCEQEFKIDKCYPIDEFEKVAPQLLSAVDSIYYRQFKNKEVDEKMEHVLNTVKQMRGRTGYGLLSVHDADTLIGEMRLVKSEYELTQLREACEISAQAHLAAMRFTRPGVTERQVQGVLAHNFYMRDSAREGYGFIVASGNAATTLHYNFNDQVCKDGDLLLIDAGAEYNYYTGDITRTYPVNGKFTDEQGRVYEAVLKVQKAIVDFVKPGIVFKELHDMGTSMLTDAMLELGLLSGRKDDLIQALAQKKYYPHGIGHWLGLDVHDAGLYFKKGEPRPIEANMCFTIEPGLYIPADDTSAPQKYRGIGIRIEDNVRVTSNGVENMTTSVPKEISDIEKVVGKN
ncbi:aminopeptidase P family protein [Bdellovibrio sp. SKB1291214]|uniref:aminopeptidase P family protein n=1 Tax=Bdellovibrio sp. SKB1291214 TaxID=1732569 RepID=UPI000B51C28E|nr:aminopeptidase P family protein [Bdellovibrio sp. SKB1291214]UYL10391.1 aminopeptidase P family protein [Bdellovibrio sp. SKB1291214]